MKKTPKRYSKGFGLISSVSEAPAKIYPLPEGVKVLLDSEAVFSSDARNLLLRALPLGWSLRTSLVFSRLGEGKTLPASLRRLQDRVLASRKTAGEIPGPAPVGSTRSPGLLWTVNTTVWRSGGSVCSLSEVLEADPLPAKYWLSPMACRGILRRAERRGKQLPQLLKHALEQMASQEATEPAEGTSKRSQPAITRAARTTKAKSRNRS